MNKSKKNKKVAPKQNSDEVSKRVQNVKNNLVQADNDNFIRDFIPLPANASSVLNKTLTGGNRFDKNSFTPAQLKVLYETALAAQKRTGKTAGGTEYEDYESVTDPNTYQHIQELKNSKVNPLTGTWYGATEPAYNVASTIGRYSYGYDPNTKEVSVSDIYNFTNEHTKKAGENYMKGRLDPYGVIRRGLYQQDKNQTNQEAEPFRSNFVISPSDTVSYKNRPSTGLQSSDALNTGFQKYGGTVGKKNNWLNNYAKDGKNMPPSNLWETDKTAWMDSVMNANANKDWVQQMYNPKAKTLDIDGVPRQQFLEYGEGDGRQWIYPTINRVNGIPTYFGNNAGYYAAQKQLAIPVETPEQADYFIQNSDRLSNSFSEDIAQQRFRDSYKKNGGMIKRADGSYSQRGLWDNIRANAGSGKKPTKEMLKQEKKIRAKEKAKDGWKADPNATVSPTPTQGVSASSSPYYQTGTVTPLSYEQKFLRGMQENQPESVIREAAPRRSAQDKRGAIARNPMTAAQYIVRGQEIPDYFEKGDRNIYENAMDVINPMSYYDAAQNILTGKHFKDADNLGQLAMAVPLTMLDAAQFLPGGAQEKAIAKGIKKEAPAVRKAASHVVDREASLMHFPEHNKNYILKDGFNVKDLEKDKSHVGVIRDQKVKINKYADGTAKIQMSDVNNPSAYFTVEVSDLNKKTGHPKVTKIDLFGQDANAANSQMSNLTDFFPKLHVPSKTSLSAYSTPLQNLKTARLAKDKGRIKIKPTGEMVPDNYIYKSGFEDKAGRLAELKEQFPRIQRSFDVLGDVTKTKFPKAEVRIAPSNITADKINYRNSVPINLEDVNPDDMLHVRMFRPDYDAFKNFRNGGVLPYYPIAKDGWSSSQLAALREAQANPQSAPYPDMDPAMLRQYRLMEELSTAAGRARVNKEKVAKETAKKDKETSEYIMDKAAQQRAQEDPSMFSPSFWKEDPMTGRRPQDRLYDMGTDIDTRVAPRFGNFTDYLQPANYAADVAKKMLQAPLRSKQENSVMPYVYAAAEPIGMAVANKYVLDPLLGKAVQAASPYIEPYVKPVMEKLAPYYTKAANLLKGSAKAPNSTASFDDVFNESSMNQLRDEVMERIYATRPRTRVTNTPLSSSNSAINPDLFEQNLDIDPELDMLVRRIESDLRSRGHQTPLFGAEDFIRNNLLFDENGNYNISQLLESYNANSHNIDNIIAAQKPIFIDLAEDPGTMHNFDYNTAEGFRYKSKNNAGDVKVRKIGNDYYSVDIKDPTTIRRKLSFSVDKSDPEFPNIDDFSFFNDSPISSGKQVEEMFKVLGPKVQMKTRGSTSIYSTNLWYKRIAKFIKDADAKSDANTPFGKRITINNVKKKSINSIVKSAKGQPSAYLQIKQQIPHIQESIKSLSELSGTELPPLEIKYKGEPISIEDYMKLGDNPNISHKDISTETELFGPDFSFKKYYKDGGKIKKNWLQNY